MRRIIILLTATAIVVAMMAASAAPTFAKGPPDFAGPSGNGLENVCSHPGAGEFSTHSPFGCG